MSTTQGIKLDDGTQQRLRALAEKRDRTPHWIMKAAIESYLTIEEKYEQEKAEDLLRWEQYQTTGTAVEHKEVTVWLDQLANGHNEPWQN